MDDKSPNVDCCEQANRAVVLSLSRYIYIYTHIGH